MKPRADIPTRPEGGYILLALLAASAILLAGLALSVPHMAVQSQRVREEVLIQRGEEYRRAIRLYYLDHQRYPEEIEDLEETDGVRYLRRRYEDPLGETGEWRLIHMGTDGRFEDSLLYDQADPEDGQQQGLFGAVAGQLGTQQPASPGSGLLDQGAAAPFHGSATHPPGVEPAEGTPGEEPRFRDRRESAAPDLTEGASYDYGFNFSASQAQNPDSDAEADSEPEDDYPAVAGGAPAVPGGPQTPGAGIGPPGFPAGAGAGWPSAGAGAGTAAGPGGRTPDSRPGSGAVTGAAGLVNRLLTTPRPGGLAGARGQLQAAVQLQVAVFQRGIAGVASTLEEKGVKLYQGRELFSEWEFVFDYRDEIPTEGQLAGTGQRPPGASSPGQRGSMAGPRNRRPTTGGAVR